jgi:hypothetical protein
VEIPNVARLSILIFHAATVDGFKGQGNFDELFLVDHWKNNLFSHNAVHFSKS